MKTLVVSFLCLNTFLAFSQKDSLKLNQDLEEVVITVNDKSNDFYSKRDHYILDMIEDSTGLLLLLKKRNTYSFEKVNWNGFVSISTELPFRTNGLTKDCLGNFYFERANDFQRFHLKQSTISFDEVFSVSSYFSEIAPCVASSHSKLLFNSLADRNQSIYLWTFDFKNDSTQTVYLYKDSASIHSNKDEFGLIVAENYTNHQRMGDITVPELELLKDEQERAMFFNMIVTKATYCPTFSFGETHHFFQFEIDSIYSFNEQFDIQSKSPIPFKKSASTEILLDQKTGQFYTVNLVDFSLEKFKIGDLGTEEKLTSKGLRSSKKVIHNNRFYFVGKSTVDDNFNRIFREKL